ncbi:MAG: KilA-N domain-containing protein [Brachymonas sp.]|nr:KilA-N domain-containing protein [Brachymonas sp.]
MEIQLFDQNIRMLDGLFCLNDLHKASGGAAKHKPSFFLRNEQTQKLLAELRVANSQPLRRVVGKGKEQGTYVCLELVYAYAMWISAAFYLKVIRAYHAMSIRGDALRQALAKAEIAHDTAKESASDCGRGLRAWRFNGPVFRDAIAQIKRELQLCLVF